MKISVLSVLFVMACFSATVFAEDARSLRKPVSESMQVTDPRFDTGRGTGQRPGIPERIQPHDKVDLRGMGSRQEGEYYIDSPSHSISGGGYKKKFETER